ncbi:MAG: nuclear transport factor 2 family protein [Ferruginibacter sp.]
MTKKALYRAFLWMFIISITAGKSMAQTAEDSVKATVNDLFTAMKNADTALLRSCFADSAILQTIVRNKEGKIAVRNEAVNEFVSVISKEQKGDADEQIQFDVLRIDGPLAIVWTPYKFYYKQKFSHCGVNSFQLIKVAAGWKIQYLIDTRRRQGCN